MTSQCYLPRSSERSVIGAVFVTIGGVRRFIPDHFLAEAELSEQGRLLRLIYTCCTVEVAGQRLEVLFEDAIVGRLGTILQSRLSARCLVISRGSAASWPSFQRRQIRVSTGGSFDVQSVRAHSHDSGAKTQYF